MTEKQLNIESPPTFCQYASGACDQDFSDQKHSKAFFVFPSEPGIISSPIELAIEQLRNETSEPWKSWRELPIEGQIIFCEICKAARFSTLVVADVTTMNFNVMFEIGYAIGLNVPVMPIRDSTYVKDEKIFDALGILDTFGYHDFRNADGLAKGVRERFKRSFEKVSAPTKPSDKPLYVVRSPIDTDGQIKMLSVLKKSALNYRSFDPKETSRLSLHEAKRQIEASRGVVTYLLNPDREGALVHNARCAFVAGLAMAAGKRLVMLQEGEMRQPIDYRDMVRSHTGREEIPTALTPFLKQTILDLQESSPLAKQIPPRGLEKLDLGDLAAENEIGLLRNYFVSSGQYLQARRGHGRLVVGRKGSGKTAIFYRVRDEFFDRKSLIFLDLKPEGHQFTKLREAVLNRLSPGLQEHTMTAFWEYLILMEIAHKVVDGEVSLAYRDARLKEKYDNVAEAYGEDTRTEEGDFSERLLRLVDAILERSKGIQDLTEAPQLTQLIYEKDVRPIQIALNEYLSTKEKMWVLVDNLDKGWPVRGAAAEDIMILRCLLDAMRKIQRDFERRKLEFKTLVFIRNDIYELLLEQTPDKGKDTVISLDWNDPEFFREIIRKRIQSGTGVSGSFQEIWGGFFDAQIGAEDSFRYLLTRTLMRPREIIRFVRKAVEVAINRNHQKVLEDDMLHAEIAYSEDSLQDIMFELKDINPSYPDIIYDFLESKTNLPYDEVASLVKHDGMNDDEVRDMIWLLVWFGFLGVLAGTDKERYSYQVQYNLKKMNLNENSMLTIHPAFRRALECQDLGG
ncbi:MAG: hypothetical protein SWQ30_21515 [Thermodesulfobacteriota bacterium]|nr:hypothetical protein [Thermodesulfobacteriota bacterium]